MKSVIILVMSVVVLSHSVVASAKEVTLEDIKNLQQQMSAISKGSIQSNGAVAEAVAAAQNAQSEVATVKAQLEANKHLIESMNDSLKLKIGEMDARLQSLEEKLSIQSRQVTAAVSSVAPEAANEIELYQKALDEVNDSEFLKAIATFKQFLKKYPKSIYASYSQYWIGECYFAMRDYEQSIREFQTLTEKYKKSEKEPAALLKQGYAFFELDMDSDGKLFLNTLIKRFPSSREAKEAKERLAAYDRAKAVESQPPTNNGGVPLAPGVEVPEDTKFSNEKYK